MAKATAASAILPRLYLGGFKAARSAGDYALIVNLSAVPVKRSRTPTILWPIEDGSRIPNEEALWAIARHVADILARSQRSRVLVHCSAGRNRAALLCTLVVMLRRHVSGAEAVQRVRAKRPGALDNPAFEKWLLKQKVKEKSRG